MKWSKCITHGCTEKDTIRLYFDFTVIYGCDFGIDDGVFKSWLKQLASQVP